MTEAKVESVMGAYNRTNGEPCCASPTLIGKILRGEWEFEGYFVSDCFAIDNFHLFHGVTKDAAESAALALKAGCDLCAGQSYSYLREALERGLITEEDIDRALERTYTTRFRLGMFDPAEMVPYTSIPMSVVNSPAHRQLAYQAAVKSVVLLKNNGVLPIRPDLKMLFLTGPNASNADSLIGNYYGISDTMTTMMEGIAGRVRRGCAWITASAASDTSEPFPINWAIGDASQADLTIACMGLLPRWKGRRAESILSETRATASKLACPPCRWNSLSLAAQGSHVVLVVFSGSAVLDWPRWRAWWMPSCRYGIPGQEGGRAVADVLFGDHALPGGCPSPCPSRWTSCRPSKITPCRAAPTATRREPLYPFGFGLSYTQFTYRDLQVTPAQVQAGEAVTVTVTVTNIGERAGDEVVQVYLRDVEASVPHPILQLVGFRRVPLAPGETQTLTFTISPEQMACFRDNGQRVIEAGRLSLWAAANPTIPAMRVRSPPPSPRHSAPHGGGALGRCLGQRTV